MSAPVGTGAGAIKPLLDGVIAALHTDSGKHAVTTLRGWGAQDRELALLSEGPAPLGSVDLITMAGARPCWNPSDDLFDEVSVRCSGFERRCGVEVYPLGAAVAAH
ncbi:MAG: hypothetical protein M3O32_01235 [Actinomycetota bacterium]|nr:hypothetical protein [Actinomycetota bacterium]